VARQPRQHGDLVHERGDGRVERGCKQYPDELDCAKRRRGVKGVGGQHAARSLPQQGAPEHSFGFSTVIWGTDAALLGVCIGRHQDAVVRGQGVNPLVVRAFGSSFVPSRSRYSITRSAVANSGSGMVRPSALAVLRLIANSTFVICSTGRSVGFSPLRMRPA
jgi:hypothetical protein